VQWTLDLQSAQIPDAQANGQISGGPFTAERALLQRTPTGYLLMVREGAGPQIDRELRASLPLKPGEKLDGNSWNITENTATAAPRIVKRWLQNARQQTQTFTNGYAMKLEFSQTQSNELPAKLFIALPDEEKSFVAGTLKASFLVAATPAPQATTMARPQTQQPRPQTQQPAPTTTLRTAALVRRQRTNPSRHHLQRGRWLVVHRHRWHSKEIRPLESLVKN
jgi:hypothetical protein